MSKAEEELQARYGTQRIESDEDDELLGTRDDDGNVDNKIDRVGSDDVIIMSSRYDGSSPTDLHEEVVVECQYEDEEEEEEEEEGEEFELDYDEVLYSEQGRSNPSSGHHQQQLKVSERRIDTQTYNMHICRPSWPVFQLRT